jgi:SAM-dependent methyltransferase
MAPKNRNRAGKDAWIPPPRYLLRKEIVLPMARRIREGGRVLEIGVGAGDMALSLSRLGYIVDGIDASEGAVAEATVRAGDVARIVKLDLFDLPQHFDPATFDGLIAMEVLEHIQDDAGAAHVMAKLLAPGGIAILTVPAHPHLFANDDRAVGHYRRYTREGITSVLQDAGFSIETLLCYGYPLGNLLKWVRARRSPPPEQGIPPERLSDDSGINDALPRALRPLARRNAILPFLWAQRAFFNTDRGEGYVIAARA